MNKLIFKVAEKISYKLDELCMYIIDDGRKYEEHKILFNVLDKMSTSIYNVGYNKCVLGAK